jgi:AraC family transcriptional regulator
MREKQQVRTFGGQDVWRRERVWEGVGFEHARWRVEDEAAGFIRWPDHLLFVTLSGRIGRTSVRIEGGERYEGADFPGAMSFVPSLRQRSARFGAGTIEYAAIRLDPAVLPGWLGPHDLPDSSVLEFAAVVNRPDPLVHQLALALVTELRDGGEVGRLFVDSIAATLMAHLVRTYSNRARRPVPRASVLAGRALRDVLAHIDQHLGEDLRLAVLAEVAGVDRWRLARSFKAATGSTPHRFVLERRLERARELLGARGPAIAEIAYRTGFSSQSHLTTAFRQRYGVTPMAYRSATT